MYGQNTIEENIMQDLIEIALDLSARGANVVIKNNVLIVMNDKEFASYMSELMAS